MVRREQAAHAYTLLALQHTSPALQFRKTRGLFVPRWQLFCSSSSSSSSSSRTAAAAAAAAVQAAAAAHAAHQPLMALQWIHSEVCHSSKLAAVFSSHSIRHKTKLRGMLFDAAPYPSYVQLTTAATAQHMYAGMHLITNASRHAAAHLEECQQHAASLTAGDAMRRKNKPNPKGPAILASLLLVRLTPMPTVTCLGMVVVLVALAAWFSTRPGEAQSAASVTRRWINSSSSSSSSVSIFIGSARRRQQATTCNIGPYLCGTRSQQIV
jgi:hypothetical protein